MRRAAAAATVLGLAGALASASLAQATPAPAGQRFGGGGTFAFRGDRLVASPRLVSFSVAADGASARVYASVVLRCGGVPGFQAWVLTRALIAGGKISFSAPAQFTDDDRLRVRMTITAQVAAGGVTGSLHFTARRGRLRCTNRSAAEFVARPAGLQSGTGPVPPSTQYRGMLSAPIKSVYAAPIVLITSPDARRVLGAVWTAPVRCNRTGSEWWDNLSPPASIRGDGTFVRNERFTVKYDRGERVLYRVHFAGKLTAQSTTGSLRVRETVRRHSRVFERCDSGELGWTATA